MTWDILGIERTVDRTAIRRAYARKLKVTHPEDDAAGFQALREAYDHALAWVDHAERRAAWEAQYGGDEDEADDNQSEADLAVNPEATAEAALAENNGDAEPGPIARTIVFDSVADLEAALASLAQDAGPAPEPASQPAPASGAPKYTGVDRRRPPPTVVSDNSTFSPELGAAEMAAFDADCAALERLILDPQADREAMIPALKAVLNAPAMERVAVHERTELWLARLVTHAPLHADELLDDLIRHFRWSNNRIGADHHPGAQVVARASDRNAYDLLARPTHPSRAPFRALNRRPDRWRRLRNRLSPGLKGDVIRLLATVRERHPGMIDRFNPEAMAWWDDLLERPHIGAWTLWVGGLAPLLVGFLAFVSATDAPRLIKGVEAWAAALAAAAAVVAVRLYAIEWPRLIWQRDWDWKAPLWLRAGWAPGALAVLLLAVLAPASLAVTVLTALAAAVFALWAAITGEPDRRELPGASWAMYSWVSPITLAIYLFQALWRPGMRYAWRIRTVFAFAYLGAFWLLLIAALPSNLWGQTLVPVLGAAAAFSLGASTLEQTWTHILSGHARLAARLGLTLGAVLLAALAWTGAAEIESFRAPLAGLAAVLVLLHKTPAYDLVDGPAFLARDLVMRFGWIIALAFAAGSQTVAGQTVLAGVLWLMSGVTIAGVAGLWGMWRERKRG